MQFRHQVQGIGIGISCPAHVELPTLFLVALQGLCRVLEAPVLQQPPHQFGPRVLLLHLVVFAVGRHQHLHLDDHEGGRHGDELARLLQADRLDHIDVLDELVGDP